jgi:PKD repeat protein
VHHDCNGLITSDMPITSYSWDFGDGSPAGSGVSPTHAYASGGGYDVTLTVSDGAPWNGSGQTQQTVTVATTPVTPATQQGASAPTGATGQRAAALKSCKKRAKKHNWSHSRLKKCKQTANLLSV